MKYLYLTFLIAFPSLVIGQELIVKNIDKILTEVDSNGPGVLIGVIKDQQLIYASSRGLANLDYSIPITENSNFRLSSTSKQFTAACILHLEESNQLKLNDPISKFFPEFSPKIGKVTIQHLLNHTSGIRDYMSLLMIKESRQMDFFNSFIGNDQDIMDLLINQDDLAFESGSLHSYSNTNYWLLGEIVERITKKTLGMYAYENIFSPLGMKNTSYVENPGQIVTNRVSGYVSECPDCPRQEYRSQPLTVGDGGVVSSVQDLVFWEKEFHEHRNFSNAFWNRMQATGRLNNGRKINYAAGLIKENYKGQIVIKHSGQVPGFSSEILRFPKLNLSIIVLGNQNWYDIRNFANQVADLFISPQNITEHISSIRQLKSASLTSEELDRFCADYFFQETQEYRTINREGDQLLYLRNNGPTSKLIPLSNNILTFEDRPNIRLYFEFQPDGTNLIEWKDAVGNQHAKSYKKAKLNTSEMPEYVSTYKSNELDKTLEISLDQGQLTLSIFERKIPLSITIKDKFTAMGMFTLKFERDAQNVIKGFRLDAPRAGNIYFERK